MAAPTNYDQTNEWLAEVGQLTQQLISLLKAGIDVGQSGEVGNLALFDTLSVAPVGDLAALQQALQIANVAGRGVVGGSGSLMANGAYGLGGAGSLLTDYDIPPSKNEFFEGAGGNAIGDAPVGASFWPGLNVYRTSSQRAARVSINTNEMIVDGWTGTTKEMRFKTFTNKNILGAVSRLNGIPNGAILERGSNSNGKYVKFANGLLFCIGTRNIILNDAPAGSALWTFPAEFTSSPSVDFLLPNSNYFPYTGPQSLTQALLGARLWTGSNITVTLTVVATALGFWYE